MASIGTPRSNSLRPMRGLSASSTLAGPPDRMMALGPVVVDHGLGLVERMDLAIDAGLAHPAGDQLGHLAAEIDDQNALVVGFGGHGRGVSSVVVSVRCREQSILLAGPLVPASGRARP
jgi:hypothetical protein